MKAALLLGSTSKGREQLDLCLMECVIWCAYLNAYLPVATHIKLTSGTKVAFVVGLQVDGLGSHVHVEHGGVEGDAHVSVGLAVAVQDTDGERVETESVG